MFQQTKYFLKISSSFYSVKHTKIWSIWKHGEAASANPMAVETERRHLQNVLKEYPLQDIFNFDEMGFFAL
jgi:hypothetical protein